MSLKNNLYNEDSIKSLSPLEFTRLRPGVYVGSTEYSTQLLIEIVSNAIDEFRAGHGDTINVTIQEDNTITVEDFGQGFLINAVREEDNKTVLEAAFSVLNTSGKYDEDNVYDGVALGLNGIGSKLCVFLSSASDVLTHRDGKYEHIWFTEGVFDHRIIGDWDKKPDSGTIVTWKPSPEFFEHTEVNYLEVDKLFKVLVCLCPGLKINVNNKGKELNYYSKNGINDLIDSEVKKDEVLKNRLCINFSEGKNKLDLVATYTSGYNTVITPYVNTGLTQAGPHITSIKSAITREFNKFFREKGWLKEKDSNLTGDDLQEGLYLVFNITAPGVSYDAQTKSRIVKIDMTPFTKIINESIQKWLSSNEKDVKQIVDKALNARKAREAARKARDAARGLKPKKESGLKAKMQLSNKFIDCTSRDPKKRKLLLVEGLSAGASAVEARNPKTDCIYMLKGKILSCRKTTIEKILANQELSDIIKVIGAGFNKEFDVKKMNFDKIVITSDADSDGANIELLLITFFFTYMRPLVEAGKLYRAITPLYIVRQKGNEYYCYTDDELEDWKKHHPGTYDLIRAKG